jgi:gliding motility-associated-like protein
VTLTVTDVNGNVNTASAVVTVQDTTLPTVITQPVTVQLNASGTASITAAQVNNGSSDNCSIASVVVSPSTFNCTNIGANTVTLTVTDVNGNVNTASAVVTISNNFNDTDGDGIKDNCDDDDDNDGESDTIEIQNGTDPFDPCSFKIIPLITSSVWNYWSELDCDNDGLSNGEEIGPDTNNPFDPNNNSIPDYLEDNNHQPSEDGIEVFNLLTPNDDGENDVFVIRNIGLYPDNSLEVYNRWGSKVYSVNGYGQNQNYFRGVSEGNITIDQNSELPVGTYWYVLNYKNAQGVWNQRIGYIYLNK